MILKICQWSAICRLDLEPLDAWNIPDWWWQILVMTYIGLYKQTCKHFTSRMVGKKVFPSLWSVFWTSGRHPKCDKISNEWASRYNTMKQWSYCQQKGVFCANDAFQAFLRSRWTQKNNPAENTKELLVSALAVHLPSTWHRWWNMPAIFSGNCCVILW